VKGAIIWNDPDLKLNGLVDEDQVNLSEKICWLVYLKPYNFIVPN
jgi:hypothetical protein